MRLHLRRSKPQSQKKAGKEVGVMSNGLARERRAVKKHSHHVMPTYLCYSVQPVTSEGQGPWSDPYQLTTRLALNSQPQPTTLGLHLHNQKRHMHLCHINRQKKHHAL